MTDHIDVKKALRVAYKVLSDGTKDGDWHHLSGLYARSDFDGYTVVLKNDYVTLTLLFHSNFTFEFLNQREKELFLEKIDLLDKPNDPSRHATE